MSGPQRYLVPDLDPGAEARVSIEERRSVFECRLVRVTDEEQARAVVQAARQEHPQARHHCTAWVIGSRGELMRSNDDGEPSGTAGVPMLEVLRFLFHLTGQVGFTLVQQNCDSLAQTLGGTGQVPHRSFVERLGLQPKGGYFLKNIHHFLVNLV